MRQNAHLRVFRHLLNPWGWAYLALFVLCLARRFPLLTAPLTYDEAYTLLAYVLQGPQVIISKYDFPNNHVFGSLLVYPCVFLFGLELPAIRLAAFIAGLFACVLTFILGKESYSAKVALVAALWTAMDPLLSLQSALARGYSISTALILGMCIVQKLFLRDGLTFLRGVLFSLCGALAIFTVPTSLIAVSAIYLSTFHQISSLRCKDARLKLMLYGGSTLLATALLYAPILDYIANHGAPTILGLKFAESPTLGQTVGWSLLGWPLALKILMLALLLSNFALRFKESRLGIPLDYALICITLMEACGIFPPPRALTFILPLLYIEVAAHLRVCFKRACVLYGLSGIAVIVFATIPTISYRETILRDSREVFEWLNQNIKTPTTVFTDSLSRVPLLFWHATAKEPPIWQISTAPSGQEHGLLLLDEGRSFADLFKVDAPIHIGKASRYTSELECFEHSCLYTLDRGRTKAREDTRRSP